MKEIWKTIDGFPDYQVSNKGRLKSINYNNWHKEGIFRGAVSNGYYKAVLCKDGKKVYAFVHRLVAKAFIPNPDNLPCVNHKDENKLNNNVENLEWCTHQYNLTYNNLRWRSAEHYKKPIIAIDENGNETEYPSFSDAQRALGIPNGNIVKCCKGERNYAGGYRWKYKEVV